MIDHLGQIDRCDEIVAVKITARGRAARVRDIRIAGKQNINHLGQIDGRYEPVPIIVALVRADAGVRIADIAEQIAVRIGLVRIVVVRAVVEDIVHAIEVPIGDLGGIIRYGGDFTAGDIAEVLEQ